ncbi:hypothetical protein EDD11_002132 [Mortierella claussenii]|nr:hypothetical protein EDD11_002132 [Mortierella claussenii]
MFNSPLLLDFNAQQKRSKITKACDNCRRRRVKCDGVPDGCGGCKAAKTQCVYTTSNTKRGPPKGYVEVIEDRLGKIESMLTSIVKKKSLTVDSTATTTTTSAWLSDIEGSNHAHRKTSSNHNDDDHDDHDNQGDNDGEEEEEEEVDHGHTSVYSSDLVEVKRQPASPALHPMPARSATPASASGRSGSTAATSLHRHSPLMSRNRSLTSLLPFSNDSSLQHQLAAQQEARIATLTNMFDKLGTTSVRTTVPFPWLTPEQSRPYGRNYLQFTAKSLEPALPPLACSFAPTMSSEDMLELINSFFDHFNTFLPIIHRPTLMKQWQRESCQQCCTSSSFLAPTGKSRPKQQQQVEVDTHKEHQHDPIAPLSPLLLNALLAVAPKVPIHLNQDKATQQKASTSSQAFFDAARLLLDDFLDVPRVSTVQALCLMSQFHHDGEWKATRSSGYLSMAIRMAHELGLNRDPEMVSGPEADTLRCLWWSMFILDHQFSTWLGLGLLMQSKESSIELPMDYNSSGQDLRGFVYMIRLVKILGSVLQHSYSTQSLPPQFGGHDSMVSFIEGSLTSWLSNLAPDMRWQNPHGAGPRGAASNPPMQQSILSEAQRALAPDRECSDPYPAYLYIVYNTTLILLHRPYIVGVAGSPAAAQSNTICTGSGRAITDIAQGLDMQHCSFIVNRFALYALLQAGVIHAMNVVYDQRGSEVAMDYYQRTLQILTGFLSRAEYSGGVMEGIKILEQFLATTSMAAAQDLQTTTGLPTSDPQDDGQPNRKKRQLESGPHSVATSVQYHQQPTSAYIPAPSMLTPTALSLMASSSQLVNRHSPASLMASGGPSQQQLSSFDLKEQQKQQQLKIQQQHRMYQQMQAFGTDAVKVESKAESDMRQLGQQQQQQQQLLRQQLQRQPQRQQMELEMKGPTASGAPSSPDFTNQSSTQASAATPVIPSHRYALQMLQQQREQHFQQFLQPSPQNPMTITTSMSIEAQSKTMMMNGGGQGFSMSAVTTSASMPSPGAGYDPTQFWVDFSAADALVSSQSAGLEEDELRISSDSDISSSAVIEQPTQPQFGAATPLWM